jgi:hypothetical protein
LKILVGRAIARVLFELCSRGSGGAHDINAPIGKILGEYLVAAGNSLELKKFRRNGSAGVLLDDRAGRERTARDVQAEIRRGAGEVIPSSCWRAVELELLRTAGRAGRLNEDSEARGTASVDAKIAIQVAKYDR